MEELCDDDRPPPKQIFDTKAAAEQAEAGAAGEASSAHDPARASRRERQMARRTRIESSRSILQLCSSSEFPASTSQPSLPKAGDDEVIKEGFLRKKGGQRRNWLQRWVIVTKTELSYWVRPNKKRKGVIPLVELSNIQEISHKRHPFSWTMQRTFKPKKRRLRRKVIRTYHFEASSESAREKWISLLRTMIGEGRKPEPPAEPQTAAGTQAEAVPSPWLIAEMSKLSPPQTETGEPSSPMSSSPASPHSHSPSSPSSTFLSSSPPASAPTELAVAVGDGDRSAATTDPDPAAAGAGAASIEATAAAAAAPSEQHPPRELVRALYSYTGAPDSPELSFNEGDIMVVLARQETGWIEVERNGELGLVPQTYVANVAPV